MSASRTTTEMYTSHFRSGLAIVLARSKVETVHSQDDIAKIRQVRIRQYEARAGTNLFEI